MKIFSTVTTFDLELPPFVVNYLLKDCKYLCFLDSSLYPNKYSKFSYIGWDPKFVIKSYGYRNEFIDVAGGESYSFYQHPLRFLEEQFRKYLLDRKEDIAQRILTIQTGLISEGKTDLLPDFRGGFIGYFSYDLKNFIEVLPQNAVDDLNLPLFYLAYFDKLISYNHREKIWYFIRNFWFDRKDRSGFGVVSDKNSKLMEDDLVLEKPSSDYVELLDYEEIIERIRKEIKDFKKILYSGIYKLEFSQPQPKFSQEGLADLTGLTKLIKNRIIKKYLDKNMQDIQPISNFSKEAYLKTVAKAKDYIHNGDIYQVNLSQRFESRLPIEAADLYYILREKNPAPFASYLSFPEVKVGSSSPERFLFLKDGFIYTRPIKGTRPRGKNSDEDTRYILDLKRSIKDKAELNMIVDLERNDLGKICYYGTVRVSEHATIEKYARVFHSVSTIEGRIKEGVGIVDILKATFPGGSITGVPKIRAMEIIDELEPNVRSIYTGSIGYIGIDFTMDLNIAIRTFIIKEDRFCYTVGGGIVEDSIPEEEYQETLDKGIALWESLKFFESKNLKIG